jgi:hypothetical protein
MARKTNTPRQSVTVVRRPPSSGPTIAARGAGDGDAAVEAEQLVPGVDVASGGLGDDDADAAGEALDEPGDDQHFDGGAGRAQQ